MRILVGTIEIAGQLPIFADGFRQLGHHVTTVIKERHSFFSDIQYDVDISRDVLPWPEQSVGTKSRTLASARRNINRSALLARLLPLIAQHDVFVFQWAGTSLTERNKEFRFLNKLGKKIVSIFCGSDVRHSFGYNQLFDSLIAEKLIVDWHSLRQDFATDPLSRPLTDMRMAELYSDLILSVPSNSTLGVRPFNHFFVPVNLSEFKETVPERETPIVVHAPSDKAVKGTDSILAALEQLRLDGVRFELRMLHGVPHSTVVSELIKADVVVDQLNAPLHGGLGVEAMASGCALATGNLEEYEPFPPNRPIWHVDGRDTYSQLKRLLTDKELRIRLAREGRRYVERYHDHVQVASRILEGLSLGQTQTFDHYPTFFARNFQLPDGVVIPEVLKLMTTQIVQRWGLPANADPQDMIRLGLMSQEGLVSSKPIPRWAVTSLEDYKVAV